MRQHTTHARRRPRHTANARHAVHSRRPPHPEGLHQRRGCRVRPRQSAPRPRVAPHERQQGALARSPLLRIPFRTTTASQRREGPGGIVTRAYTQLQNTARMGEEWRGVARSNPEGRHVRSTWGGALQCPIAGGGEQHHDGQLRHQRAARQGHHHAVEGARLPPPRSLIRPRTTKPCAASVRSHSLREMLRRMRPMFRGTTKAAPQRR
jgi:hypothetical protein